MSNANADQLAAIAAYASASGRRIIISTDADLTPPGKRYARIVQLRRRQAIRWYVSGRIYATRPTSDIDITRQWLASAQ